MLVFLTKGDDILPKVKKDYENNVDYYNRPFATMLRKLIDKEKIATQNEVAEYVGIARQSISSYQNGESIPNIIIFEKIVEFFNIKKNLDYSTDYWLGLSKESYKYVESKDIYDRLGLTEKAQINLETTNQLEKLTKYKNRKKSIQNNISIIDTINLLLSELEGGTRKAALLDYINTYINLYINKDYIVNIQPNGEMEIFNKNDNEKHKKYISMNAESQIDILMLKIQQKLAKLRTEKQEQINIENTNTSSENSKK